MASQVDPHASIVLSPEDAQVLFAVINRTSGTVDWAAVANDVGTSVDVAHAHYTRVLRASFVRGLPGLATNGQTAASTSADAVDATVTTRTTSDSASPTRSANAAHAVSNRSLMATSSSSTPSGATAATRGTNASDLRARVLPRLTGEHRVCCFAGYKWCCYIPGCTRYTQCGYDLRVHFRKAHPAQAASFNFARLVHRTEQEARAWAQGEDMG